MISTSIQELQDKAEEIDKFIEDKILSDVPGVYAIMDGIMDYEKYLNANYKILWILKEPYDDFDVDGKPLGGGWHLRDAIIPKQSFIEFTGGRRTFEPMIYTTWGILNNFCLWENMKDVNNDPTMLNALKSIAYINVKKLPGYTTSNPAEIEDVYQLHKEILLKQINCYNPDVIICGSTLSLFMKDLSITNAEILENGSANYIIKHNMIIIDAYHPAQCTSTSGISQAQYCNDIITAVKIWANRNDLA